MSKKTSFYIQVPFTAIECLVVIIGMVLFTTLIITLITNKDSSDSPQQIKQQNQMRRITQMLFMYSNSNRNWLPPLHDQKGLQMLQSCPFLSPEKSKEIKPDAFLYYGGLMQVEFSVNMGMLRNHNAQFYYGGNTAFGDGHVQYFSNQKDTPWYQTDSWFQMDHQNPNTKISQLGHILLWSPTWTQ
ncbi:MAG: hypothetical protein WCS73_05915 [Lentisphaeria bacterium]